MLSKTRKKIQLTIAGLLFLSGITLIVYSPTYKLNKENIELLHEIKAKWPSLDIITDINYDSFIEGHLDNADQPHATAVSTQALHDLLVVILNELTKYPATVINKYLKSIAICESLVLDGLDYGGTATQTRIYLTNKGKDNGYNYAFLSKTLHHEFSSLLIYNNTFPIDEWLKHTDKDFQTYNPQLQTNALKHNSYNIKDSSMYYRKGFVNQYGMTNFENDINTFAELLFTRPDKLRSLASQYPSIEIKYELIVKFYTELSPDYKWSFLQHSKHG